MNGTRAAIAVALAIVSAACAPLRPPLCTAGQQYAVQDTLYFAGEAADFEGEHGTVAGALRSGTRAARLVMRAK